MREQCGALERLCRAGELEAAQEHYAVMNPKMLALQRMLSSL
jgi:hypothetical protein